MPIYPGPLPAYIKPVPLTSIIKLPNGGIIITNGSQFAHIPPVPAQNPNWAAPVLRGGARVAPRAFGKLLLHLIPYVGPALYAWELYELMTLFTPGASVDPRYWDVINCTGGPATRWENFFRTSCATLLPAGPPAPGTAGAPPDPYTGTGWSTLKLNPNVANRYMSVQRAQRKVGAPSPTPIQAPDIITFRDPSIAENPFPQPLPNGWNSGAQPQPGTSPWVNIDPSVAPVNGPAIIPVPLPVNAPLVFPQPGIDPAFQPSVEPAPSVSPKPQPYSPSPGVVITPQPSPYPGVGPDIVIEPVPGPGVSPYPRAVTIHPGTYPFVPPPAHQNTKDKPGENTKKLKGKGAAAIAGTIFGAATEGIDLIDAAWNALPKNGGWQTKNKGVKTSPQQKVKDIYDAFGKPGFNVPGFAIDFAKNAAIAQAQDAAIGKASNTKGANKAVGNLAPGFGYGAGPAL